MVDLLRPKNVGFRRDIFPDFEAEKGERAQKEHGIAVEMGKPVWPANDPRWLMKPPFLWVAYTLKWGGPCVYCAERIEAGTFALYSRRINSVAHRECHAGVDR